MNRPQPNMKYAVPLGLAVFALQPVVMGGWLALIPRVQTALGLTKADLAIALLAMPLALVLGLKLASPMNSRLGPRRMLMLAFLAEVTVFPLIGFAWSLTSLFAILFAVGTVIGFSQIGLNVFAGRLEKQSGILIMNRCHGAWALGLMAGSAIVAVLPALSVTCLLLMVGGAAGTLGFLAARALPHLGAPLGTTPPPSRHIRDIPMRLILISAFVFPVTMTEGAMADWAAVYLTERLGGAFEQAGIAVTIYAGALALGRFAGDALKYALGAVGLARLSLAMAISGLLMLVVPLPLIFAYLGFGLAGLGVSVGFPLCVSAVAALDETHEGPNVAFMSMVAIAANLAGPPLIGLLAQTYSLALGLAVLLPGLVIALFLSRWLSHAGRVD